MSDHRPLGDAVDQEFRRLMSDIATVPGPTPELDELHSPVLTFEERTMTQGVKYGLIGAVAAAVAIIVGLVLFLDNGDEGGLETIEQPDRTPVEVVEALEAAIVGGDWRTMLNLYSSEATYTQVDDGFGWDFIRHGKEPRFSCSFSDCLRVDFPLSSTTAFATNGEPLTTLYENVEWDGEPGVTGFDDLATLAMAYYARGVTDFYSCSQTDGTTVVCDLILEGDAFVPEAPPLTDTFTVIDGLITEQVYDTSQSRLPDPIAARIGYQQYVDENSDAHGLIGAGLGELRFNPDTIDIHRQLIAEWRAQPDS